MSNEETMTDDEIDELFRDMEAKIQQNKEFLDNLPEFDPKYRRMEEAKSVSLF